MDSVFYSARFFEIVDIHDFRKIDFLPQTTALETIIDKNFRNCVLAGNTYIGKGTK